MKASRILNMEKYILEQEAVSMEELQDRFGMSANTVRRDISELIARGTAEKVYGGVRARHSGQPLQPMTPYDVRKDTNEADKRRIGHAAARLVEDGDIIFLDSGTTTPQMIACLGERRDVTVITHNLEALVRALPYANLHVIALPGELRRQTDSLVGSDSVQALRRYNLRKAFIGARGVLANGPTSSSTQEYDIKQAAVELSEQAYLLADRTKFGVAGMRTFAALERFAAVVTDALPEEPYRSLLEEKNVRILLPDPE